MTKSASIIVINLFFVTTGLISLNGCGHDPDPCKDLIPVSADFKFKQSFYGIDSLFKVDTVYAGSRVTFSANENNASYNWKVGDNPDVFTKQSFFVDFTRPYGKIEVTLIINKQPNSTCFPKDNGIDTVKRNLFVIDPSKIKYAFEGTFTGYLTDKPQEIFDITIVDFGPVPNPDLLYPPGHYGLRIYNLPKGCGNNNFTPAEYAPEIKQSTYRNFYIEHGAGGTSCGKEFNALGRVYDQNNKIIITFLDYDFNKKNLVPNSKQFIGNKKK